VGVSSRNFLQSTCRRSGVIMWVQFSEGPPPKIWEGKKTSKIPRNFWQLSILIANIFGTDRHVESRKICYQLQPILRLAKKLVNFGPQTTEIKWLILTNPGRDFPGDYISAIRECCPLNFLSALEIDQGYLAHTPTGTGTPEKKINRENLIFDLKFSVWASITSMLVGISSPVFYRRHDELWSINKNL